MSDDNAYIGDPFSIDSHVGRFDYEGYKREFELCKGILFPRPPDPRVSPEVDHAWELAYERYMDEEPNGKATQTGTPLSAPMGALRSGATSKLTSSLASRAPGRVHRVWTDAVRPALVIERRGGAA